jgi:hypothetical protein
VIREEVLDDLVVNHLADILLEPQRPRRLIEEAIEAAGAEQEDTPRQLEKLMRRKSAVESAVSRMHLAIERGLVDFDDRSFADRIRTLREERPEIEIQIGARHEWVPADYR